MRKLDDFALQLLTAADAGVTELVLPDCAHLSEGGMIAALSRLATGRHVAHDPNDDDDDDAAAAPAAAAAAAAAAADGEGTEDGPAGVARLGLVDLGFCGRPRHLSNRERSGGESSGFP